MRLLDNLLPQTEQRSAWPATHSFQQFVDWFTFQSQQYGLSGSPAQLPSDEFADYVAKIHRATPIISAAAVSRSLLISQLRFLARADDGSTSSPPALGVLRRPGAMKRSAFLALAELHTSYAGAAYPVLKNGRLYLLRPDWVQVILGSNERPLEADNGDLLPPSDTEVLGLAYQPKMGTKLGRLETFQRGEFTIWAPEPDPVYWWRGVSWVSAVLNEFALDGQVSSHQRKFFDNAGTPNLVFLMDPSKTAPQIQEFAKVLNEKHAGPGNAHKNMFLGGGTDVKVVGADLKKLALNDLSGSFETRVASRSMVPAVILGIREGLGGSALNSGNYGQTRRQWADKWFTPTADGLCEAFEDVVNLPSTRELTWDRSRVMFLQEDEKDAADIANTNAAALRQLVDGGFEPESVITAISTGDMSKLKHTGTLSVQLQPPGSGQDPQEGADE